MFHVERYLCKSRFYLETQGVDFITDSVEEPASDYMVSISEDLHAGAIVETVYLADTFSAGPPFKVRIVQGV